MGVVSELKISNAKSFHEMTQKLDETIRCCLPEISAVVGRNNPTEQRDVNALGGVDNFLKYMSDVNTVYDRLPFNIQCQLASASQNVIRICKSVVETVNELRVSSDSGTLSRSENTIGELCQIICEHLRGSNDFTFVSLRPMVVMLLHPTLDDMPSFAMAIKQKVEADISSLKDKAVALDEKLQATRGMVALSDAAHKLKGGGWFASLVVVATILWTFGMLEIEWWFMSAYDSSVSYSWQQLIVFMAPRVFMAVALLAIFMSLVSHSTAAVHRWLSNARRSVVVDASRKLREDWSAMNIKTDDDKLILSEMLKVVVAVDTGLAGNQSGNPDIEKLVPKFGKPS